MANHFIIEGKNPYKVVIISQLRQIFKLECQFIYIYDCLTFINDGHFRRLWISSSTSF